MIIEKIGKQILFFDGAMGSLLQKRQLKAGELPEAVNLSHRDVMVQIHSEYIEAGANVITTNTFGAFPFKYENLDEITEAAVENAKAAIKNFPGNDLKGSTLRVLAPSIYIAFGMGPTGKLLKPMGDLPFEDCVSIYKAALKNAQSLGVDLILFETFSDLYELKAAIIAAKEVSTLPIAATMTFDANGRTMTGCSLETMVTLLEGLGVAALGINCGLGPDAIKKLIPRLCDLSSTPIIVQPNAGLPVVVGDETVYDFKPEKFASVMEEICRAGVGILGGCCGTTPEHISLMTDICKNIAIAPIKNKELTMTCSYSKTVIFSSKPIIVGERVNPTKREDLTNALKNKDYDTIIDEIEEQTEENAQIIDINVATPFTCEEETLAETVEAVQEIINIPLQLDSANHDALERAVRIYNGKCVINSVTGKEEDMARIFPLAKKYGGIVIGLTIDENGIPDEAQQRFRIAEKIIQRAADYGIEKKDIIIDPLALPRFLGDSSEETTLEALKLIKQKLQVNTILGISNISHGLRERDEINAEFLKRALDAGLDVCIVNPASNNIRDVLGL